MGRTLTVSQSRRNRDSPRATGRSFVFAFDLLLTARDRTLVRNLGFEITQPRPERALAQIHFCDANRAPLLRLGEHAAVLAIDSGQHPVARNIFISTADEVDLIFARSSARLLWIAAPHRPRNDFCAAVA